MEGLHLVSGDIPYLNDGFPLLLRAVFYSKQSYTTRLVCGVYKPSASSYKQGRFK